MRPVLPGNRSARRKISKGEFARKIWQENLARKENLAGKSSRKIWQENFHSPSRKSSQPPNSPFVAGEQ